MPKQLKQTDQARADQQTTREYSRLFSLAPGTRFSKVPLTLRARNQMKTALPAMLIKDIFQNLLLFFFKLRI